MTLARDEPFSLEVPDFGEEPEDGPCLRCGRANGHEQTCPNGQHATRYVDVNVMLERQAADQDGEDDEPAPGQETLFGNDDDFRTQWQEWRGMPEYVSRNLAPFKSVLVHFETEEHYRAFAELVGQKWLTRKTRSIWYPEAEWARERGVARYADISADTEQREGNSL